MRCTSVKPYGVTGETLEIRGQQTVSFVLDNHEFKHWFYICSLPTKTAGAKLDIGKGEISLALVSKGQKMVRSSPAQAALTVFTLEKEGYSPSPRQQLAKEKDGKISESTSS